MGWIFSISTPVEHCEFNDNRWQVYRDVNRRFAEAVIEE
jgi:trehalose-6-phosphate synthase